MSVSEKVTRLEIVEALGQVFDGGGATREQIVAAAQNAGRPEVVEVLSGLQARRYGRLNELWEELRDVPIGA